MRYLQRRDELYLSCFSWTYWWESLPHMTVELIRLRRFLVLSCLVSIPDLQEVRRHTGALWRHQNLLLLPSQLLLPFDSKLPIWNVRFRAYLKFTSYYVSTIPRLSSLPTCSHPNCAINLEYNFYHWHCMSVAYSRKSCKSIVLHSLVKNTLCTCISGIPCSSSVVGDRKAQTWVLLTLKWTCAWKTVQVNSLTNYFIKVLLFN